VTQKPSQETEPLIDSAEFYLLTQIDDFQVLWNVRLLKTEKCRKIFIGLHLPKITNTCLPD